MTTFSQEVSLKEQVLEKFKSVHYSNATSLLEQALKQSPNDAEIYYYLGWFNHYNAYDSRPFCFSNASEPGIHGGLNEYFQNLGLVSRLTPIKTKDTKYELDISTLEQLFKPENFTYCRSVKESNFLRMSGVAAYGYPFALLKLAKHYRISGKGRELQQLVKLYKKHLKIDFNAEYEQYVAGELETMLKELKKINCG